ncbi:MAG: DUF1905 domain-containing protein [Bacteroidota bacterium]
MMQVAAFITHLERKPSSLSWNYTIDVPLNIAEPFIEKDNRRVICTLNEQHEFHAALMPNGNGGFFITINSDVRKKLKIGEEAELNVQLRKDRSKYGIHLPEEMEELLLMDEEGSAFFHQLTPGKQRSLLHIVGKPKSSDIRLKKAVVVLDHLKTNNGKLDFKVLNVAFKEANRRG